MEKDKSHRQVEVGIGVEKPDKRKGFGYNFFMQFRRYFLPGGTYFFTVVTYNRRKIFIREEAFDLFNESICYVQGRRPFNINAFCICPDHIHMIWTLPENDADYPTRWRLIKSYFSHHYQEGESLGISKSGAKVYGKNVWQHRYWEHFIRNEEDYSRHVEYIHFNPVKHGLASSPSSWEHSSFLDYVSQGLYPLKWGMGEEMRYLDKFGNE